MADNGIEALRRGILQDAEAMASQEVAQARLAAREELERDRREAESEAEVILRQAEHEAERLRRRIASAAELEGKRRWLEVREQLLRRVLGQALEELREGAGAKGRGPVLLRLLLEAARRASGGRLVVRTAPGDATLLTPQFLEEARAALAKEGISARLERGERLAEIAGGVIVEGEEGRIVVDNSFEARMERQEATLRSGIWRILSGEDESRA